MNCRFCKTELTHVFIDLGTAPPSNSYLTAAQLNETENYFPLKVFVCSTCFLVQVDEYKKASEIFNNEYAYFSSYSTSWLAHAKAYTGKMIDRFGYDESSLVVEIASNDGYLLQYFKERNIPVLGIEPTESTARVAREKGIESISEFFGEDFAKKMAAQNRKADLLLGNNVLAHVPDINDFVEGLRIALAEDGVITMEFPHLVSLIHNNQFDTIYHEHFSYLSFITVSKIFEAHGLVMFDVEEIPTHGGSLRIYAKHKEDNSKVISQSVTSLLEREKTIGIMDLRFYEGFEAKAQKVKTDLLQFLNEQKKSGKKVAAYGAAAKGNTLLNYCGIKNEGILFVVDASPYKQGQFLPGSHIPIVAEDEIRKNKPDYVIIFPWNIKEEIMNQLSYIRQWGGQFVISIPEFQVI